MTQRCLRPAVGPTAWREGRGMEGSGYLLLALGSHLPMSCGYMLTDWHV